MKSHHAVSCRLSAAAAAVIAALVAIAPHPAADAQAPRALPGAVEEVYADPVDLMYSYGPSDRDRAALRAESAFTASMTVTYDAGFNANPQAQAAFQAAVDIWKSVVASPVLIRIRANYFNLGNPNVLGSAGPTAVCTTANGLPNTVYAAALADKLNGSAFCAAAIGATTEIVANFNSTFTNWDFGTSGAPVAGKYNFMTVVLHEIGHGLGFYGSMTASGGVGSFGYGVPNVVDIYDRFAVTGAGAALIGFANPSAALGSQLVSNNTFFSGGNARGNNGGANPKLETHHFTNSYGVASDNGFLEGSSYSHIDDVAYTGTPNGVMTWRLAQAEVYTDPGPIVRGIFADTGWSITPLCWYSLSASAFSTSAKATTSSVGVSAPAGCGWTAVSNASWLAVIAGGSGNGNGSVTFAVAANNGPARVGTLTIAGIAFPVVQAARATLPGDFDGDGRTDTTVFRPSTGIRYTRDSSTGNTAFYQWGANGDVPVPGDYDGDARLDRAVYRPATGIWYVLQSSTNTGAFYQWGLSGTFPCRGTTTAMAGPTSPSSGPRTGSGTSSTRVPIAPASSNGDSTATCRSPGPTTVTARPTSRCSGPLLESGTSSIRPRRPARSSNGGSPVTCRCRATTTAIGRSTSRCSGPRTGSGTS